MSPENFNCNASHIVNVFHGEKENTDEKKKWNNETTEMQKTLSDANEHLFQVVANWFDYAFSQFEWNNNYIDNDR